MGNQWVWIFFLGVWFGVTMPAMAGCRGNAQTPNVMECDPEPQFGLKGGTYIKGADGNFRFAGPTSGTPHAASSRPAAESPRPEAPSSPGGPGASRSSTGPSIGYNLGRKQKSEPDCRATAIAPDAALRASMAALPKKYCSVLLTAAHCLRSGLYDTMREWIQHEGAAPLTCRGEHGIGVDVNFAVTGGPVQKALAVLPKNEGADIGMLFLPCEAGASAPGPAFPLSKNLSTADAFQAHVALPVSNPGQDTVPIRSVAGAYAHDGGASFVGAVPKPGDSGSGIFQGGNLIGVVSGYSADNNLMAYLGSGAEAVRDPNGRIRGQANYLRADIEQLMALSCDSACVEPRSKGQANQPPRESEPRRLADFRIP